MNAHHRFDQAIAVTGEFRRHRWCVNAMPPIAWQIIDDQPKLLGQVAPQRREMTCLHHENVVAGRERINDRGLPGAGAAGGKNKNLPGGGFENRFHPFKTFAS